MIDTYLYVLNHSCQRIHLETFFFFVGGLVGLAVAGTTSADIIPGGLAFSSIFSVTSPRSVTVTGPEREPFSASSWTERTPSGRGAEVMVYREATAVESNEDESLTWTVLQTVEGRDVRAAKFRCDADYLWEMGPHHNKIYFIGRIYSSMGTISILRRAFGTEPHGTTPHWWRGSQSAFCGLDGSVVRIRQNE